MSLIGQLLRVLRAGVVTTSYPARADVPDRGHRGTPELLPERCTSVAACERVCPTRAIQLTDGPGGARTWAIDYGLCILCGACVLACDQEAIVATSAFDLASKAREGTTAHWRVEVTDV